MPRPNAAKVRFSVEMKTWPPGRVSRLHSASSIRRGRGTCSSTSRQQTTSNSPLSSSAAAQAVFKVANTARLGMQAGQPPAFPGKRQSPEHGVRAFRRQRLAEQTAPAAHVQAALAGQPVGVIGDVLHAQPGSWRAGADSGLAGPTIAPPSRQSAPARRRRRCVGLLLRSLRVTLRPQGRRPGLRFSPPTRVPARGCVPRRPRPARPASIRAFPRTPHVR